MSQSFHGQCHCGNLELTFETNLTLEQLPIRACTCSFCRKYGVRSTSDPNGKVKIAVHDTSQFIRYRFGLKTADFLICGKCGIYVAAVMPLAGKSYATVNVNALDASESFMREPLTVNYDRETAAARRARREKSWTPVVEFREGSS